MSELTEWLERLGLARYATNFADNEVEFADLNELSDDDLKDIGLPLGPRRRVLKALRQGTDNSLMDNPFMDNPFMEYTLFGNTLFSFEKQHRKQHALHTINIWKLPAFFPNPVHG